MASTKIINIAVLTSLLCGCAQFGPFVDRRREAGGFADGTLYVGKSTDENPAICYNRLYTSFEEVQALADEECKKNKTGNKAVPVEQTIFTCRLLVPNHYYFKCEQ
ncbi:MAG: hypothetical protein IKA30_04715 [Alphaproteobacteria bacterium]|nr:hypothetical protein [Alphaproteobacteria bacterium]